MRDKLIFLVPILVVAASCGEEAAKPNGQPGLFADASTGRDASVSDAPRSDAPLSDASLGDASTTPPSDQGATPFDASLPPKWVPGAGPTSICTQGEPGCTCGWGTAVRLAGEPYTNPNHALVAGRAGHALVIWSEDVASALGANLWLRQLDPAREIWGEPVLLSTQVADMQLGVDRARDNWLVIRRVISSGVLSDFWTRFDAGASAWIPLAVLPFTGGRLIADAARGPVLVAYPRFSYFDVASRSWSAPVAATGDAPAAFWGPDIAIDDDRNMIAAWNEMEAQGGSRPVPPLNRGVQARYYDYSKQSWEPFQKLSTSGAKTAVFFDDAARAHVIADVPHRYDPAQKAWAQGPALPVSTGDFALVRDERGNLQTLTVACNGTDCRLYATRFDLAAGTWASPTELGIIGPDNYQEHFAGVVSAPSGHALAVWALAEGSASEDRYGFWATRFDPQSGAWSLPELVASGLKSFYRPTTGIAIGPNGHAAVAWMMEYEQPDGSSYDAVQVARWDPGSGRWSPSAEVQSANKPAFAGFPVITVDGIGNTTVLFREKTLPSDTESALTANRWACRTTP
jgi:hypothetical protein